MPRSGISLFRFGNRPAIVSWTLSTAWVLAMCVWANLAAGQLAAPVVMGEPDWDAWWKAQAGVRTWQASFKQERLLVTLDKPLETPGRVWYAAPDFFRWELGDPVQTIAMRSSNAIWLIYPKLRRAERYQTDAAGHSAWAQMASMFEAGFPQSREALEKKFRPLSTIRTNGQSVLSLAPRGSAARRFLPELRLGIEGNPPVLSMTSMKLADGSLMKNYFSAQRMNEVIPRRVLEFPDLDGYTVTEPGLGRTRP